MTKLSLALLTLLVLLKLATSATLDSPVGKWKTIDDQTGRAKSIVEIKEVNGELMGKVLQVLDSAQGPHPTCIACSGERKNQPVEGMTIMWGVRKSGDSWSDGKILDPKNGKTYSVKLSLTDGGKKLDVHGYLGLSLLGRSQTWLRVE